MSDCCGYPPEQGSNGATTVRDSVITCPHCGTAKLEHMPIDACRIRYECSGCGAALRPKPGDCCVFCSYGSVRCPPMQSGTCCSPAEA